MVRTGGVPRGLVAGALSAALLFAAFPPLEWPALAWVALVPILLYSLEAPPRAAALSGFFAGALYWLATLAWLTRVSWAGWMALSLYCALYSAAFTLGVAAWAGPRAGRPGWGSRLALAPALAAGWVGWEYLRSVLLTGFPWNALGVSQFTNTPVIQLAELGGVPLVSGLVALVNAAVALVLFRWMKRGAVRGAAPSVEPLMAALAVALALGYGRWAVRRLPPEPDALRVAAVQVNVPQAEKWSESWTAEINRRVRAASLEAVARDRFDLLIWPETVVPDFVRTSRISRRLVDDVLESGVPLLLGAMDFEAGDGRTRYYNSAFLFEPGGGEPQVYAKQHLVLFGEYVPFSKWLPWLRALTPFEENFSPGSGPVVFRLPGGGPPESAGAPRTVGVLICFEDTVARLARAAVRAGARLLINQTNDAWFDPSWASRQHLAQSLFRCVETRVGLVRATNTGVTCRIDRLGRIRERLPAASGGVPIPEVLPATAGLAPPGDISTLYGRLGDWVGWGSALAALALLAAGWRDGRRRSGLDRPGWARL